MPKMHADEVETDVGLVHRLLAAQFPDWAELPIARVDSYGTDHDIYRVGNAPPAAPDVAGVQCHLVADYARHTESGEGDKITLYEAPDAENEALWIADKIEAHMARNPEEHIAVLYRTNAQSRQIEEALRRSTIEKASPSRQCPSLKSAAILGG